jgi:hypothetical protein
MSEPAPTDVTNLDRYGDAPLEWSRARDALATWESMDHTYFLGTCRPDGTPHSAGVGAQWQGGHMYFTSSPEARKARDLAANPACTLSAHLPTIDLVLDGSAARVTDPATLEQVAATYRESGWPVEVEGDAFTAPFSAPSAGPPPWHLYEFVFRTVIGVATAEPNGATRWRFDPTV